MIGGAGTISGLGWQGGTAAEIDDRLGRKIDQGCASCPYGWDVEYHD